MKKRIKITESDLHSMILSAINEAYGTPLRSDQEFEDDVYDIANGDTILPRIIKALKDCYWDIQDNENEQIDDPRFNKIVQLIRSAILNAETLLKDEKMKRGLQPDPFYDSRHSARQRHRDLYKGNGYRPTFDNAKWPHERY